uniref:Uncharacterized protein n=1 Tax=Oryza barthii TaxID=65489 RepID=A0A0D3HS79_9ORYZ
MARRCGSGGGRPSESELPRQPPVGGIDAEVVALTLHSIVSTARDTTSCFSKMFLGPVNLRAPRKEVQLKTEMSLIRA